MEISSRLDDIIWMPFSYKNTDHFSQTVAFWWDCIHKKKRSRTTRYCHQEVSSSPLFPRTWRIIEDSQDFAFISKGKRSWNRSYRICCKKPDEGNATFLLKRMQTSLRCLLNPPRNGIYMFTSSFIYQHKYILWTICSADERTYGFPLIWHLQYITLCIIVASVIPGQRFRLYSLPWYTENLSR